MQDMRRNPAPPKKKKSQRRFYALNGISSVMVNFLGYNILALGAHSSFYWAQRGLGGTRMGTYAVERSGPLHMGN